MKGLVSIGMAMALIGFAGCRETRGVAMGDGAGRVSEAPEKLVVRVLLEIRPDQVEAFLAFMKGEQENARTLDGCERYELFQASQQGRFLLYEEWSSPEQFDSYKASPELANAFKVIGPMLARPPESAYFRARLTE